MTYNQTKELFDAMDNLVTYSKMFQAEFDKHEDTDYDMIDRYSDLIEVARRKIFDAVAGSKDA